MLVVKLALFFVCTHNSVWSFKTDKTDLISVYPRFALSRHKRETGSAPGNSGIDLELVGEGTSLVLELEKNGGLVLTGALAEWHFPNGSTRVEPILAEEPGDELVCLYRGIIAGQPGSLVAVNICGGLRGYLQTQRKGFVIEPKIEGASLDSEHLMRVIPKYEQEFSGRRDRVVVDNVTQSLPSQQLQDETNSTKSLQRMKRQSLAGLTGDEDVFTWYDVDVDAELADQESLGGQEWEGHVVGKVWQVDSAAARRKNQQQKGHIVCNGPYCEYFRVKKDEPKWLETTLFIDSTVIEFHGRETVKKYILTLINIVSAIYGDPTLGANLKFVILRMIFYDDESVNPIVEDDERASLDNVNMHNQNFWEKLPKDERHDIAVWMTKRNFGGPSGYAPVSGVCDPERSCSLNRDEGLSSAFILAHELGHILGLSHDGDTGAGNTCTDETHQSSVMAPIVAATFSYFHWSSCSAGEYHFKADEWTCMKNFPKSMQNATWIGDKIEYEYSLDDQCRMEFGDGFSFCHSFELTDPCVHLWCSHQTTPDLCKTKKGPPMDGTACGDGKWCVEGSCESTNKRRASRDGLRHNALAGGWGEWSDWGSCSRTCGTGVEFRLRRCDNPRPAYGGDPCRGEKEEFRLCNINRCNRGGDSRAEQCRDLFSLATGRTVRSGNTWHPFEPEDRAYQCKLACYNRETKEYYRTRENLIDGTPCSYDKSGDICVQGNCIQVGCDKIMSSPLVEDACGVCAGDGSKCVSQTRRFRKRVRKEFTKIVLLPKHARNIEVKEESGNEVFLVLRERRTEEVVLDGRMFPNGDHFIVLEGAKFKYKGNEDHEILTARGPLLAPVILAITGTEGRESVVVVKYSAQKKEILSTRSSSGQRYEWQAKGWGRCSRDCGGGTQRLIVKCHDSFTGFKVKRKLCGPKSSRPLPQRRPCNEFDCQFEWVEAPWEECSSSCGETGVKYREIYCLPKHKNRTDELWHNMVDIKHCPMSKPQQQRECNRMPCPAFWVQTGWSSCSVTCGLGYKKARHECHADSGAHLYSCGAMPRQTGQCLEEEECPAPCQGDESPLCSESVLMRYCEIPSYRKKCCTSCQGFKPDYWT